MVMKKDNKSNWHNKNSKKKVLPTIGSYSSEAISGKAFAANKNQRLEIGKGPGKQFKDFIGKHHPLEPELLQANTALSQGFNPRVNRASPVMRDQIEVGEVRLSLQSKGLEPRKASDHSLWADRIAIPYEHSLPAKSLYSVPWFAHQRHRVSVPLLRHELKDVLYYLVWEVIHPCFFTVQDLHLWKRIWKIYMNGWADLARKMMSLLWMRILFDIICHLSLDLQWKMMREKVAEILRRENMFLFCLWSSWNQKVMITNKHNTEEIFSIDLSESIISSNRKL